MPTVRRLHIPQLLNRTVCFRSTQASLITGAASLMNLMQRISASPPYADFDSPVFGATMLN